MRKIGIVYWSGTGNTELMAQSILEGVKDNQSDVTLYQATEFTPELMDRFDAIGFGCPAMGSEELEASEFAPMFNRCKYKLANKKIVLFGSWGWGDGEWMSNWVTTCQNEKAILLAEPIICNSEPDSETLDACVALGKTLATC